MNSRGNHMGGALKIPRTDFRENTHHSQSRNVLTRHTHTMSHDQITKLHTIHTATTPHPSLPLHERHVLDHTFRGEPCFHTHERCVSCGLSRLCSITKMSPIFEKIVPSDLRRCNLRKDNPVFRKIV